MNVHQQIFYHQSLSNMLNSEKITREFKRIQSLGFIKSNRANNTGIGKTFEDYLGVRENNSKDHDFEGFEVKSQREMATSYITLFTKNPTHPRGANRVLKDTYGKPDAHFPQVKVLHTSIFGDRFNTFNSQFGFKMKVDNVNKKLLMDIKNLETDTLYENDIYWDFNKIQGKKLDNTFVVWADRKYENGIEYFHYTRANVYYGFSFERLIEGVKNGYVMFDIRMGSYKSGINIGKPHDHGSGFRVKRDYLKTLFDGYVEVE